MLFMLSGFIENRARTYSFRRRNVSKQAWFRKAFCLHLQITKCDFIKNIYCISNSGTNWSWLTPYIGDHNFAARYCSWSSASCSKGESLWGPRGDRLEAEVWFWQLLVPDSGGRARAGHGGDQFTRMEDFLQGRGSQFLEHCIIMAQHQAVGKHLEREPTDSRTQNQILR